MTKRTTSIVVDAEVDEILNNLKYGNKSAYICKAIKAYAMKDDVETLKPEKIEKTYRRVAYNG
ncbi:MAG: hypothetical protein ACFFDT_07785 [Candidatus Hodarchaeota archaeon]